MKVSRVENTNFLMQFQLVASSCAVLYHIVQVPKQVWVEPILPILYISNPRQRKGKTFHHIHQNQHKYHQHLNSSQPMHRVRIVFQASMKLQNKQDIAVFKGEGEPLLYLSKQTKTNKKQASKQTKTRAKVSHFYHFSGYHDHDHENRPKKGWCQCSFCTLAMLS